MKIRSAALPPVCLLFFLYSLSALICPIEACASGSVQMSRGGQVYVPVYPSIYYMGMKKSLDLSVTLSIHNISPDCKITVETVEYFDKKGKLLSRLIAEPRRLTPLETTNFVVEKLKDRGGVGANFLVTWKAEKSVNQPIIQAIMIGTTGSQGISFMTDGVTIKGQ